jgi:hypothetical protein
VSNQVLLDAEPHVMAKVRQLFNNPRNLYEAGRFTHKKLILTLTMDVARDLVWICERFPLEFQDDELRTLVHQKANEYDQILQSVATADSDPVWRVTEGALQPAVDLYEHQIKFVNMARKMKHILLADSLGTGKTFSALGALAYPDTRPALIVCPPNLCLQWEREAKRLYPGIETKILYGYKTHPLSKVDVTITSYNRLQYWFDEVSKIGLQSVVFDEAHELRHRDTAKRDASRLLAQQVEYCYGLSGTPIFNYGDEIHNVLDAIKPNCLGSYTDWAGEWCTWGKVNEPAILGNYLKSQGLMLRRTTDDLGFQFGKPSRHVVTLDSDLKALQEVKSIAKQLALSILTGNLNQASESEREFDWKLRMATGVAKAKASAEFVKMLCQQGEKVLLAAWHREVYDILLKELADYGPVMYTGTESAAKKDASVRAFMEDGTKQVFIISLRSGAGLDGLQHVCRTAVFAELDWSPHVHDQVLMRLDRMGQTKHVQAYYLTVPDGSDPFTMSILNVKRSQHDGIVDEKEGLDILNGQQDSGRIREMAAAYLRNMGEEVPEPVVETGLLARVANALRAVRVPNTQEAHLQEALLSYLPTALPGDTVEREVVVGKRSRLDFLVTNDGERVAIECKRDALKRADVYKQVRKYAQEANVTAVVLFAPWFGISSFMVDGIPVVVVDYSQASV